MEWRYHFSCNRLFAYIFNKLYYIKYPGKIDCLTFKLTSYMRKSIFIIALIFAGNLLQAQTNSVSLKKSDEGFRLVVN